VQAKHNNSITVPSGQSPTPDSNAVNTYAPEITRRQLLTGLAASALTLTTLAPTPAPASLGNSEDQPEPAPAEKMPAKKPKIYHCSTEAYIPNRHSIKDPATLAEYVGLMEGRLEEDTQKVNEWAAEEGQIVSDFVRNGERIVEYAGAFRDSLAEELCALIDTLAALLVAVERSGRKDALMEVLSTVDGPVAYVDIVTKPPVARYSEWEKERKTLINAHLWGQEPDQLPDSVSRFDNISCQTRQALAEIMAHVPRRLAAAGQGV
jgi:hypothetical protein